MENNNKPSIEEQQAYTVWEAESVLRVEYQAPFFTKVEIETENIALEKNHFIQKLFDTFKDEYEYATVADDAKNLAEYLIVFQESVGNLLSYIKNEHARFSAEIVGSITIDNLRQYAIEQHAKAFNLLQITPERYEVIALAEKEHWRRMAVASTRAYNREKAKNL